jgi:hypothetical protein
MAVIGQLHILPILNLEKESMKPNEKYILSTKLN